MRSTLTLFAWKIVYAVVAVACLAAIVYVSWKTMLDGGYVHL